MMGPPSLEETLGDLVQQVPQVLTQRFAQMRIDFGGADTRMSQQNLDDANVHASLQQVRGEAVPQRVRPEAMIKAALVSGFDESISCGGLGQRSDDLLTGK